MLLVIDNGSVYTTNLIQLLRRENYEFTKTTFDNVSLSDLDIFDSYILSGRRKNNKFMNLTNSKIITHSLTENKPLLGICYGAEILALTLGGTIRRMKSFHKGPQKITVLQKNDLCSGEIEVYESHSYEIARLGQNLSQVADSEQCKYEIIKHNTQKLFGTQFHPEMSPDGQGIIRKFLLL